MLGHDLITVGRGCVWWSRCCLVETRDRLTVFFYSASCTRLKSNTAVEKKKKIYERKGKADGEKWLNYFWVARLWAQIGLKSSGKEKEKKKTGSPDPFADDCLFTKQASSNCCLSLTSLDLILCLLLFPFRSFVIGGPERWRWIWWKKNANVKSWAQQLSLSFFPSSNRPLGHRLSCCHIKTARCSNFPLPKSKTALCWIVLTSVCNAVLSFFLFFFLLKSRAPWTENSPACFPPVWQVACSCCGINNRWQVCCSGGKFFSSSCQASAQLIVERETKKKS